MVASEADLPIERPTALAGAQAVRRGKRALL
jgi:hypothetical protein